MDPETNSYSLSTPLFTVLPSPGAGLGCFTTTPIAPGTLLLSESPLIAVPEPRTNASVTTAFAALPPAQQSLYLSLYAQHPSAPQSVRVIDIFNSNAWQTESHTSLLPRAARFNHACVPNATFAWNSRRGQATVRAVALIPAGTEITLSYERPYAIGAARREKLAAYGFECACAACGCAESDVRRARMCVLESRIRVAKKQNWRVDMPRAALELVRLLREEGLVGEALGLALHEVAIGWRRFGRADLAVRYALRELEVCVMCYGEDSAYVEASTRFLRELEVEAQGQAEKKASIKLLEVSDV